ncbi:MAG: cupredoxin domain-containing protein [bacterium]
MLEAIKSNIFIIASIFLVAVFIFGALYFTDRLSSNVKAGNINQENIIEENLNNVSVVDGKQIIEITAKGGYRPVHSIAKVGIPTILRINTNGTFDCSSSVRIPSMNISKNLPMFGTTDIDIGIQKEGILKGTCGMGMYPFDIKFE